MQAPLPFVRSWWDASAAHWGDPLRTRNRMADGLILSKHLIGRQRGDVVAQLGEPPPTDYMSDWDLAYNLGAERGIFAIDSEWLVVRIGGDGTVTEAAILID